MDKKYWEEKEITIYWWNGGAKTLDYRGPLKGYLKQKNIKTTNLLEKGALRGYRFKIPLSSCTVDYKTYDLDYGHGCCDAIEIFLTLLGDKSKFTVYNREFFINWRP